jgi:hypothetical protein
MTASASQGDIPHFRQFMVGFAAAAELHTRASKIGAFVESVCLGASVLDAMLRVGLVLEYQLRTRTSEIPIELILQEPSDVAISEREIYKRSQAAGLIDQGLFDHLNELYNDRNRVIHRYIISRITTADVLNIAIAYEAVISKVAQVVTGLEQEQIVSGVGMTTAGPNCDRAFLEQFAEEKHTKQLAEKLRGG